MDINENKSITINKITADWLNKKLLKQDDLPYYSEGDTLYPSSYIEIKDITFNDIYNINNNNMV